MASTKSHLDKELDTNMNQAQEESWDWTQFLCLEAILLLLLLNCVCYECFDKEIVFNADNMQKCLFVVSKHVSVSFTCRWTKEI
jgi:hypothetical protein